MLVVRRREPDDHRAARRREGVKKAGTAFPFWSGRGVRDEVDDANDASEDLIVQARIMTRTYWQRARDPLEIYIRSPLSIYSLVRRCGPRCSPCSSACWLRDAECS